VKSTNYATPYLNTRQALATTSVQMNRKKNKERFYRCTCTRQVVIIIYCDGVLLSMADFFRPKLDCSATIEHARLRCTCTRLKLLSSSLALGGDYIYLSMHIVNENTLIHVDILPLNTKKHVTYRQKKTLR
jgi:hypothetical protein